MGADLLRAADQQDRCFAGLVTRVAEMVVDYM